ncbi:hypothetical protein BH09GEM1_BH09GEM1_46160 [soil metagenome]
MATGNSGRPAPKAASSERSAIGKALLFPVAWHGHGTGIAVLGTLFQAGINKLVNI